MATFKLTAHPMRPDLEVGKLVVLTNAGTYMAGVANPSWGHDGLFLKGIIREVDFDGELKIDWENGTHNVYYPHLCTLVAWDNLPDDEKAKAGSGSAERVTAAVRELDLGALDKLVIDEQKRLEVIALLKQQKHQKELFEDWGLGETIEYGRGMTMLFYGPPGTGKTWAVTCIAKALGVEVITVSAAEIQTSEPGGANRNIQEAFRKAKETGSILFLDECDGLITDRADVGMILGSEINTLLTEIEQSEGVVILATNRIDDLDAALERRLALILEFPKPDRHARAAIWERLIPKKLPLDKKVTTKWLSDFELTGGEIKNVLLQAARLAKTADAEKLERAHFEIAIDRLFAGRGLIGTGGLERRRRGQGYSVGKAGKRKTSRKVMEVDEELTEADA